MKDVGLKNSMKTLWKQTFGDSKEYIDLVFDAYWDEKYVAASVSEDGIMTSLLGIPYSFGDNLRGLYLCGLATDPLHRRKGLMSGLIENINTTAKNLGFDFTFLIPANEGLFKYYEDRGYTIGAYRIKDRFVANHNFDNDIISSYSSYDKNIYEKLNIVKVNIEDKYYKNIYDFISKDENNCSYSIKHSFADIANIIKENKISGGFTIVAKDENIIIKGLAFIEIKSDAIFVPHLFYDDDIVRVKLLSYISKFLPDLPLEVCYYPQSYPKQSQLWSHYNPGMGLDTVGDSETNFSEKFKAHPYGMFRLLDRHHVEHVMVANGLMQMGASQGITDLDFARIIWRNPLGSPIITDAFEIKPLPTSISLLLD